MALSSLYEIIELLKRDVVNSLLVQFGPMCTLSETGYIYNREKWEIVHFLRLNNGLF